MLHIFRESVGRYVAIAILALIAVTFVFFGIDFTISQATYAAKVNREPISLPDFEREVQLAQNEYQQQTRSDLSDDLRLAIRQDVLDRMVLRESLQQAVDDAGYHVSEGRLNEAISSTEAFQVGGQYSEDVALSLLASQGLTPAMFRIYQRDSMQIGDWQDALTESAFITPAEFRTFIEIFYETRDIAWALFESGSFVDQVEVTDEDIEAFYDENPQQFMTEESVDIEFVELDLASVAATIEISDERLLERYEQEADLYAQSEERSVRHILIEVADDDLTGAEAEAEAQAVIERLAAGEDFAALAAEVSDDPGTRNLGGDLGWITRGVLPGPFEDALFAMNPGDIEGPVETEFGFHVLQLEQVRVGEQAPFEAVREQILEEIASDEAYATFLDQANELDQVAYDAGPDLAGVAEQFGLELETIAGLTRNGGSERFFNPAPIIDYAFSDDSIATGNNSPLIDLGQDNVVIVRVTSHNLPEVEPLESVTDRIRDILVAEGAAALAAEAATEFQTAFEAADFGDEAADAAALAAELAAEHGAIWNQTVSVRRADATVPGEVLRVAFAAPRPAPESEPVLLRAPVGAGNEAVIVFSGFSPGVPDDIPSSQREIDQEQLRFEAVDSELNAYARDARQTATVRVPDGVLDPDL